MAERSRLRLKIYGQVQGVFFRYSVKDKAEELGLIGWARNTNDGGVEVVAEGEKEKLNRLLEWSKVGPSSARVDRIEKEWQDPSGEYDSFQIY